MIPYTVDRQLRRIPQTIIYSLGRPPPPPEALVDSGALSEAVVSAVPLSLDLLE